MQKWEYNYVYLSFDDKKKNWIGRVEDKDLVGYTTILDALGERGWELVSIVASKTSSYEFTVFQYLATFKRPRE